MRPWLVWLPLVVACDSRVASDRPAPRETTPASPSPAPARTGELGDECITDDDCALVPAALTCCNECPPAPPFDPAPRWVVDGMLIQLETDCARSDRLCVPAICERVPEGCVARAVCARGRCIASSTGCELPLI
ncbi:MAG TPA: hypothetical protein VFQ53_12560 [Kofleriaceae bacterium]|nr:hypothetical protein [Kofleriaceae bacterium]